MMGREESVWEGWFEEGLRWNKGLALACVVDLVKGREWGGGTQNLPKAVVRHHF